VKWPARVKTIAGSSWQPGHVLNLSVTGVLVQVDQVYEIGERVEIEIDFFVENHTSVVTGVGRVVREQAFPRGAAIQFDMASAPKVALP
jgi:hypothetical protein